MQLGDYTVSKAHAGDRIPRGSMIIGSIHAGGFGLF